MTDLKDWEWLSQQECDFEHVAYTQKLMAPVDNNLCWPCIARGYDFGAGKGTPMFSACMLSIARTRRENWKIKQALAHDPDCNVVAEVEKLAGWALDKIREGFNPDGREEPESFKKNLPSMRVLIQSAIYEALARMGTP